MEVNRVSEILMTGKMPVLALRGLAIFPDQTVHFDVGRVKSALALEAAMKADQTIFLVPQKNLMDEDPGLSELYPVGCVAQVKQILKPKGDAVRVLVTGLSRAKILELTQTEPYMTAVVEQTEVFDVDDGIRGKALRREANNLYDTYLQLVDRPSQSLQLKMLASTDSGFIADCIAQNSGIEFEDKAKILCQLNITRRLEMTVRMLRQELRTVQLEADIQEKTKAVIDQDQRDYYLREQMKVIREELGEPGEQSDYESYKDKLMALKLEKTSEEKLLKDLDRMVKQPFGSSETAVLRNYLDTVLELPWNVYTKERVDVEAARKILDHDHFGMEKVKERILETLAIRKNGTPDAASDSLFGGSSRRG
jgi:ATP-dependent Lon protease